MNATWRWARTVHPRGGFGEWEVVKVFDNGEVWNIGREWSQENDSEFVFGPDVVVPDEVRYGS